MRVTLVSALHVGDAKTVNVQEDYGLVQSAHERSQQHSSSFCQQHATGDGSSVFFDFGFPGEIPASRDKTPERIERGNPIWAPAPSQGGGNPCPPFQARIRGGRSSRSHHGGVGAVASTIGQALMSGRRQCPSLTD